MRMSDWSSVLCFFDLLQHVELPHHWLSGHSISEIAVQLQLNRHRIAGSIGHSISEIAVQLQPLIWLAVLPDGHSISEIAVQLQLAIPWSIATTSHSISEIAVQLRSEEHTSELQSLMRNSYAAL